MKLSCIFASFLALGAFAIPQSLGGGGDPDGSDPPHGKCTKAKRLKGAELVIKAYNAVAPGESAMYFANLPAKDDCKTLIYPNGSPVPIVAGVDGTGVRNFGLATRQVFGKVTGTYTDMPNGTTIIHTNVTLGILHSIQLPVTFYADVYLNSDLSDCLWNSVVAYARIPTVVNGVPVNPPQFPGQPAAPTPTA